MNPYEKVSGALVRFIWDYAKQEENNHPKLDADIDELFLWKARLEMLGDKSDETTTQADVTVNGQKRKLMQTTKRKDTIKDVYEGLDVFLQKKFKQSEGVVPDRPSD